jgi:hypothetical protein
MVYLLWTLLNFALLISFIVICFRATKLVKEKLGIAAAVIFAIGLLAFMNKEPKAPDQLISQAEHPNTFTVKHNANSSQPTSDYIVVPIEKYVGSTLTMEVSFTRQSPTDSVTASTVAFSASGLVGGHKWKPETAHIYPTSSKNVFRYEAAVMLEWAILGCPVYSQSKTFSGSFELKD